MVARLNAAWPAISLPWSQVRVLTSCEGMPDTAAMRASQVVRAPVGADGDTLVSVMGRLRGGRWPEGLCPTGA